MDTLIVGGIGFFTTLTLMFIVLKVVGRIDWNWFLVLSPFVIFIGLLVVGSLLFMGIVGVLGILAILVS